MQIAMVVCATLLSAYVNVCYHLRGAVSPYQAIGQIRASQQNRCMVPLAGVMRNRSKNDVGLRSKDTAAAPGPQRTRSRQKAVLPVRVSGVGVDGNSYSDLVHTLDITDTGVRLGAIHCALQLGSLVCLQYKQYKADFRVVWISKRPCGKEYQVGLRALVEKDLWGLEAEFRMRLQPPTPEAAALRV